MTGIKLPKRQKDSGLTLGMLLLAMLLLIPAVASADDLSLSDARPDLIDYPMPSADHPPVYTGGPVSIPVKALVERLLARRDRSDTAARRFSYDIDTLGMGLAVRLRVQF